MSLLLLGAGRDSAAALWTPASLSGLSGWYDPSDITTLWKDASRADPVSLDGDLVWTMDDKSGNNRHLIQATSGNRPIYRTGGGKPYLEFDGTADFMQNATAFSSALPYYLATAINRISTTTTRTWISFFEGGADYARIEALGTNNRGQANVRDSVRGGPTSAVGAIGSIAAGTHVLEHVSVAGSTTLGTNGTDVTVSNSWDGSETTNGKLGIGINAFAEGHRFYGAIAVLGTSVSSGDRANVRSFLAGKY